MEQEIDQFIRYLATERGLSDNYQLSTRRSLGEFAAWLAGARKITTPGKVTMASISEYLSVQKERGLAAASIKLAVVALKIFFRFLLAKGRINRDPTETLTLPRIERYLPETLNELQVEQLIESINTTQPRGLRDRAILELLYASGLRISELANARLENFNAEERILRVTGKGNKTRLVPVGGKACEALAAYVSAERPKLVKARTGSEIFLSARGTKLTTVRLWQIVKERARASGLETNIYPHLLR
ncbi:MAG: tyrosine-type recombinase/integrase, partial [Verrucomicrobiota bacterium]|nr:tyrosine-type recombinase/integrase [Verrucomicrobiota bacterium]